MEETVKTYRLSKIASEFNISVGSIVDFLNKKGIKVDNNPNAKISTDIYEILLKEYSTDKKVKETSKKLDIGMSRHETITLDSAKEREKESEPIQDKELFIKNVPVSYPKDTKLAEKKEEPVKKQPEPIKEKTEQEVKITPEKEDKKIVKPPVAEPEETEDPSTIKGPRVVGKIDLDKVNDKKPSKKTKEEIQEETKEKNRKTKKQKTETTEEVKEPTEEKKATKKTKKTELPIELKPVPESEPEPKSDKDTKEEVVEKEVKEETSVIIEDTPTPPVKEETKEKEIDNFIATQYTVLTGPKIIGKIELSEKPPAQKQPIATSYDKVSDRKRQRKRIKKDTPPAENHGQTAKHSGSGGSSIADKLHKQGKVHKGKVVERPEVSDEEIQKQIRETLARLSTPAKSKASKYRRQKRDLVQHHIEEEQMKLEEEKKILKVTEFVTVSEIAQLMNVPVTEIISTCMSLGLFVSINQRLDAEVLSIVAEEFGYKTEFISTELEEAIHTEKDAPDQLTERHPIVTVMGHVDHGKTLLLDYIRNSNVIAGEAGGITQHIGAYEVTLDNGKKITFLDTPGHEAFTAMRARGAKVTDIAIIVIAADDSIMPQTVEAINHAQAAKVPIIFAINKIDKPTANPEKIKEALAAMNMLVEDWGGKYQCQEISAKKGINIDKLLEKILLEAEMLELKANPNRDAYGTVLESSLEKGRGYVAKLLMLNGTLRVGDMVLAGSSYGRVKAMYNERNLIVENAGPATPLLLLGLNGAPQAGDSFAVMQDEREAKEIANKRFQLQREQNIRTHKHITLDEIGRRIAIGDFKELNIIVKGDVDGSIEALSDSLLKLSNEEVQVNVIHKSVGQITESDVLLASASNAIIIGFQVRPSLSARKLAEHEQIDIRLYSIIYTAINEITSAIEGMLSPEIEEKIVCNLEVKEVFKISKIGTIAGCQCLDGKIGRNTLVRIIRNGIVVYSGKLGSLKRFKDDVKEVFAGQECGLNIENFNDIKVEDIIEGYEQTEVKRKLG
ncbi:MAG TPA: translation initiation factor IF-2 [Bacteroidales bacterium]|nr:translation initiation factor IF-2 [Bacteroidales bacterium]